MTGPITDEELSWIKNDLAAARSVGGALVARMADNIADQRDTIRRQDEALAVQATRLMHDGEYTLWLESALDSVYELIDSDPVSEVAHLVENALAGRNPWEKGISGKGWLDRNATQRETLRSRQEIGTSKSFDFNVMPRHLKVVKE